MKLFKYITIIIVTITTSCTKVVDVDLPKNPSRLVVDASINWLKGTSGNNQVIKLTTSTPYFDTNNFAPVIGASVKIINSSTFTEFVFEDQGNGNYTTDSFKPILNQEYKLEIVYNGEVYNASEVLKPVADIVSITQEVVSGGFNEDETLIRIFFDDPKNETNFYYASFEVPNVIPDFIISSDKFSNGNKKSIQYREELTAKETITINLYGISENYFNFFDLLINQADSDGGPFPTIPSEIKGNCINIANPNNYAFGYFRLSEVSQTIYTLK